jgi:uroporphyrinogen decarboxylase
MKEYTSFDRVSAALEHKEPDRIPLDIGGAEVASINIHTMRRLRRHLGMTEDVTLDNTVIQTGRMEDDLIERLHVDVKIVGPQAPANPNLAKNIGLQDGYYRLIDEYGMGWAMPEHGGKYYDLYFSPLANAESVSDIEKYPWPDLLDPARFVGMKENARKVATEQKKAVFLGRASSGMWEHAIWMTGYEKFFMDMVLNKKFIHALMEKILEIKMKYWGRVLELVEEEYVVISCADDLGAQDRLLVGLDLYKEMIWPYHKRLYDFMKSKAKKKVYIFFHNDGAIYETLPLLIEAGIDIINPWQVNCKGMDDTARFKREFGNDLTVWGGSCDTQKVLPFGTPQEVRDETKRRIEDLAPGGGYIFAPIHIIQDGVPIENIMAMWETLQEYGIYT